MEDTEFSLATDADSFEAGLEKAEINEGENGSSEETESGTGKELESHHLNLQAHDDSQLIEGANNGLDVTESDSKTNPGDTENVSMDEALDSEGSRGEEFRKMTYAEGGDSKQGGTTEIDEQNLDSVLPDVASSVSARVEETAENKRELVQSSEGVGNGSDESPQENRSQGADEASEEEEAEYNDHSEGQQDIHQDEDEAFEEDAAEYLDETAGLPEEDNIHQVQNKLERGGESKHVRDAQKQNHDNTSEEATGTTECEPKHDHELLNSTTAIKNGGDGEHTIVETGKGEQQQEPVQSELARSAPSMEDNFIAESEFEAYQQPKQWETNPVLKSSLFAEESQEADEEQEGRENLAAEPKQDADENLISEEKQDAEELESEESLETATHLESKASKKGTEQDLESEETQKTSTNLQPEESQETAAELVSEEKRAMEANVEPERRQETEANLEVEGLEKAEETEESAENQTAVEHYLTVQQDLGGDEQEERHRAERPEFFKTSDDSTITENLFSQPSAFTLDYPQNASSKDLTPSIPREENAKSVKELTAKSEDSSPSYLDEDSIIDRGELLLRPSSLARTNLSLSELDLDVEDGLSEDFDLPEMVTPKRTMKYLFAEKTPRTTIRSFLNQDQVPPSPSPPDETPKKNIKQLVAPEETPRSNIRQLTFYNSLNEMEQPLEGAVVSSVPNHSTQKVQHGDKQLALNVKPHRTRTVGYLDRKHVQELSDKVQQLEQQVMSWQNSHLKSIRKVEELVEDNKRHLSESAQAASQMQQIRQSFLAKQNDVEDIGSEITALETKLALETERVRRLQYSIADARHKLSLAPESKAASTGWQIFLSGLVIIVVVLFMFIGTINMHEYWSRFHIT